MIDAAKLGVGREDYYLREIAEDHEAYLTVMGRRRGGGMGVRRVRRSPCQEW